MSDAVGWRYKIMNAGNIFEAFFLAKEKIAKEPDIFSDPEYMKILQSVKK